MKKLDSKGMERACELKPELRQEFASCSDVWELDASSTSTGKMSAHSLFIGKYRPHRLSPAPYYKAILSTRPTRTKPDAVYTWLVDPEEFGIVAKGGRPTKFGDKEKAQARALKEAGLSIRKIAAEMDCSTFTVQRLLKP